MAEKQVKVKVATDVEDSEVDALEAKIKQLRQQKIQFEIDAATRKLDETQAKIEALKNEKATLTVGADDSRIDEIQAEIAQLENESIDLQLTIDTSKLKSAEAEVEELDGKEVTVDLNMATQNFSQGLSQAKQGVQELYANVQEVQKAGMQSEQNLGFLELNMGAEKARDTLQQINDVVASMPGDDNTMRTVLSTAQALGNNLSPSDMEAATKTMADYMAGSATMGKLAAESQQDIMKYLLDGNTAELEKNSIVSTQVDKLKDATTFMERQKAIQEVLNDLGYGGMASLDTMMNKQAEWDGMIYNSQDKLSSMWLTAEKGAMDYIIKLNEATDGLLGIGIVGAQMVAGPLVEIMGGISQIGMGLKTLKEAADLTGITSKLEPLKNALISVGSTAKKAGLAMLDLGKKALLAGYNALKTVVMWTAQKVALIASMVAEYGLAAAQALLNVVMSMNPIMLIVIALVALAAALIWAYYNVDWFRQMVDGAWASLVQFGQYIYGVVTGAIQWLGSLFQNFTSQLGLNTNNWIQAILGFILFIPQLPLRLGMELANAIARLLGFKGNFIQHLTSAASNAVSGFVSYIQQLPGIVMGEFNRVLGLVNDFINSLPSRVWDMGAAIIDALKASLGIGSPGHMYYMFEGELERLDKLPETMQGSITHNVGKLGEGIVDSFNPTLGANGYANGSIGGNVINLNVEVGTVDSEDRVQEIVDVIRRELNWNNVTAGRTI